MLSRVKAVATGLLLVIVAGCGPTGSVEVSAYEGMSEEEKQRTMEIEEESLRQRDMMAQPELTAP